jgi:hypothetical protein
MHKQIVWTVLEATWSIHALQEPTRLVLRAWQMVRDPQLRKAALEGIARHALIN